MKPIILIAFISFTTLPSFSQGMYGFEGGAGKATIKKSYITPEFSGYCLMKLSRSFYLGGALSYEYYSFLHNYNPAAASLVYGDVISIRQKSSYLFLTPKIDFGIGYRKHYHAWFSFGPGIFLGGRQLTSKYDTYQTTPPVTTAYDTTGSYTTNNLPMLISRYTLGFSRRISTSRYWNIMFSGEYSYLPTSFAIHGPHLKTNYFCFTVGIMHKYPMVWVEY